MEQNERKMRLFYEIYKISNTMEGRYREVLMTSDYLDTRDNRELLRTYPDQVKGKRLGFVVFDQSSQKWGIETSLGDFIGYPSKGDVITMLQNKK